MTSSSTGNSTLSTEASIEASISNGTIYNEIETTATESSEISSSLSVGITRRSLSNSISVANDSEISDVSEPTNSPSVTLTDAITNDESTAAPASTAPSLRTLLTTPSSGSEGSAQVIVETTTSNMTSTNLQDRQVSHNSVSEDTLPANTFSTRSSLPTVTHSGTPDAIFGESTTSPISNTTNSGVAVESTTVATITSEETVEEFDHSQLPSTTTVSSSSDSSDATEAPTEPTLTSEEPQTEVNFFTTTEDGITVTVDPLVTTDESSENDTTTDYDYTTSEAETTTISTTASGALPCEPSYDQQSVSIYNSQYKVYILDK